MLNGVQDLAKGLRVHIPQYGLPQPKEVLYKKPQAPCRPGFSTPVELPGLVPEWFFRTPGEDLQVFPPGNGPGSAGERTRTITPSPEG
eukprot:4389978-Amphidinium_carterae.1